LRGDARVRLRAGLAHRLTRTDCDVTGVTLELADRTITLPASTAAALELLLLGGSVEVAELPGLADDDRLGLVRRLLPEGGLVPAAAECRRRGAGAAPPSRVRPVPRWRPPPPRPSVGYSWSTKDRGDATPSPNPACTRRPQRGSPSGPRPTVPESP